MSHLPLAPDCSKVDPASCFCDFTPYFSEDAADDAAFGADRGAIDGCGLRAGHERDYGGDFFRRFKALEQGAGAHIREKLLFDLRLGDVLLLGHTIEETTDTFGGSGTGHNGSDGGARASDGVGQGRGG